MRTALAKFDDAPKPTPHEISGLKPHHPNAPPAAKADKRARR
jgi:hypothetical protein